ncbi:MAG: hypothetical protein B7733_12415 [Myxococcales bacterium FL481]|nr:MAG: hypothetical protein B7733_12415 [Myxococcales bacterium FL481]
MAVDPAAFAMLLTITTTHRPATDLGCPMGKNPARVQRFSLSFGTVHVCYPEVDDDRCAVSLLLDIEPVGVVRRPKGEEAFATRQDTSDRPCVASSFMPVRSARCSGMLRPARARSRAS